MARSKGMLRNLGILLTLTSLALPFQVATSWAEEDAPDETAVVTTTTTEEASPEASPPQDATPTEEAAPPEEAAPVEETKQPAPAEEPAPQEPAPAPAPEPASPTAQEPADTPKAEEPVSSEAEETPKVADEVQQDPELTEEPAVTASPSPQIQARAQEIEPMAVGDAKVTVDFAAYTPGTYDSSISSDSPSGGTVESLTPGGFVMCGSYLYYYALVDVAEPGDFTFNYVFDGESGTGWTLSYSAPVRVEIQSNTGSATLTSGPGGYVLTGLQAGDQVEVLMVTQLQCTGTVTGQVNTQVRFDADGIGAQTVPLKGQGELLMPALSLSKTSGGLVDANANGRADAGETITYTITVSNTGNAPASDVVVTDTITSGTGSFVWTSPEGFTGTIATVAAGGSVILTGRYTITQADLDGSASITNCASIPDDVDNCVTDNLGKQPGVDITKTATNRPSDAYGLGETVTYDLVVTNTGNVTLTSMVVDDLVAGVGITCDATALASMAPGATTTCTASYVITSGDVTATTFDNTATVSGTPMGMQTPVTDSDNESVPTAYAEIMLDKALDTDTLPVAGEEITYTFTITNEGTAALSNVGVTDPMFDAAEFSCTIGGAAATNGSATLAVDGTMVCTVDYTVEQADVDAGSLENTATATGYWHDSPYTDTDSVSITGTFTPAIEIVKSATNVPAGGKYQLGDTVEYSFTVTNTGPVSLTNIQVTDPLIADLSCTTEAEMAAFAEPGSQSLLRPGEYVVCTGSHVITQADMDNGSFYNEAETTGTPPTGLTPPTDTDDETVLTDSRAMIELDKSHESAPLTVDQELTYYFVATNTGSVTLTDVGITDTDLPGISALECMVDEVTVANGEATLAPGEALECSAIYTVTQADVDAEIIENTAEVEGWWDEERVTDTDDDEITGIAMPEIEITKTATNEPEDGFGFGAVVEYEFVVTNTGNVTLVDVVVTDPLITDITCEDEPIGSLLPTASVTCTGGYTVDQDDMDHGSVPNTATVDAESTKGVPVTDTDDEVVDTNQMPDIDIVKSVTNPVEGGYGLGDAVEYKFVVENTGNVTLTDVVVTDPMFPTLDCTMETLAPDDTFDCTGQYMITQADMDSGSVPNTATATGTPPAGEDVSDTDMVTVVTDSMALVDIDKWHDEVAMTAGAEVIYHFDVTNTGTVTLSNVTVSDPLDGLSAITCTMDEAAVTNGAVVLAPGESMECTATYLVTQADVDAGQILNEATVTGEWGDETATDDDDDSLTGTAAPGIAITKTATNVPDDGYPLGALVEYRFDVTNTGNLTLTHVDLEDPAIPDISCDTGEVSLLAEHMGEISVLNPGQTISCTGEYRITQADVDAGMFHNEVTVTGQPPRELPQVEAEAEETVPTDSRPAIELTKSHEFTELTLGNEITFHLVAKNIGTVTLTDVAIDDVGLEDISELECLAEDESLVNGEVTLAPGEELWCTATYTITQADVDAGRIFNTALASGVWDDETVTDDDDDELTGVAQPAMTITKTATAVNGLPVPGAGGVYPVVDLRVGDEVTFTVVVTNTGDVTLHDVAVTDQWFADAECSAETLAVAATLECDFVHEVTGAQYEAGTPLVNVANVTALSPAGDELTGSDDETVRLYQEPVIAPVVVEKPAPTVVKPLPPRAGVDDGPINGRVDLLALVLGGALVGAAAWTRRATVRAR